MAKLGRVGAWFGLGLACAGCPAGPSDPPPPEESLELASAAPRALGALAGGTDAAPPVVLAPLRAPGDEAEEGAIPPGMDPDAGVGDAAAPESDELPL